MGLEFRAAFCIAIICLLFWKATGILDLCASQDTGMYSCIANWTLEAFK
jgi:hypothetical protein